MYRFRRGLALVEEVAAVALLVAMSAVVFLQVVYRFILQSPLSWSDELSRFLFIWATFLGSAIAVRRGGHFGVEMVVKLLPPPLQRALALGNAVAIMVLLALLTYYGMLLVERTSRQLSTGLQIQMSIPYLAIPVASMLMLLEIFFLTIDTLRMPHPGGKE